MHRQIITEVVPGSFSYRINIIIAPGAQRSPMSEHLVTKPGAGRYFAQDQTPGGQLSDLQEET